MPVKKKLCRIKSFLKNCNSWNVTDNENKNLFDPSANRIETLEDDETWELKETVEEEQTVMEDFETEDTSGHANFFYRQDGTSQK